MNLLESLLQTLLDNPESREVQAQQELEQQGSVMAKEPYKPGALGIPGDVIADLLKLVNPLDWMGGMGGASGAIIAPTGNKTLINLLAQGRNVAPRLMKRAEDMTQTVYNYLTPNMPMPNTLGTFMERGAGPGMQKALVSQGARIPDPTGEIQVWGGQSQQDMLTTLLHELGHFVNTPQVATKNPVHALETAQQLTRMMPGKQAKSMAQYLPKVSQSEDVLKKLSTGGPHFRSLIRPEDATRTAYNESLSYLIESLLQPQGMRTVQNADPMLGPIAEALGQGLR